MVLLLDTVFETDLRCQQYYPSSLRRCETKDEVVSAMTETIPNRSTEIVEKMMMSESEASPVEAGVAKIEVVEKELEVVFLAPLCSLRMNASPVPSANDPAVPAI